MSDFYTVDGEQIKNIADAIRLKRDITDEMTLDDMPMQISLIEGGGGGDKLEIFFEIEVTNTTTTNKKINIGTRDDVIRIKNYLLIHKFCYAEFEIVENKELNENYTPYLLKTCSLLIDRQDTNNRPFYGSAINTALLNDGSTGINRTSSLGIDSAQYYDAITVDHRYYQHYAVKGTYKLTIYLP